MVVFRDGDAAARDEGDAGVRFAGLRDASLDIAASRRVRELHCVCLRRDYGVACHKQSEDRQETWDDRRN